MTCGRRFAGSDNSSEDRSVSVCLDLRSREDRPAAGAAADVRHVDQHGQVEHAPELARPRDPRRELVARERYQHTEEQRPEERQNPVPERARRSRIVRRLGRLGDGKVRPRTGLAHRELRDALADRADLHVRVRCALQPHDLILELPPGSCDLLAVEPLALRKERSGDGIGDLGRALGIAIGGRDVDDVRVLLDGGLDLVGDVIAVIGPRDAPGCLVEHLAGGEQGLGGRELALGGGLVGLAQR